MLADLHKLSRSKRMTWAAVRSVGLFRWFVFLMLMVPVGIANGLNLHGDREG